MNYGVRHIKLKTVQNPEPAICRCSVRQVFLKKLAKFTEIHLCLSLFYNKVASELWQKFMSNFCYRTVTNICF